MKSFGTALALAATVSAVNVNKARHNPAYDAPAQHITVEPHVNQTEFEVIDPATHHDVFDGDYYVTGEEYHTGNVELLEQPQPTEFPRYWDNHLHYKGEPNVWFTRPREYVAPKVTYETPRYLPYIPKFKNNYVDVEKKETYQDFGQLFTPYNFYSPPEEDLYGDPIYDPKNDKLHGKDPKKGKEEKDIHDHSDEVKVAEPEEEELPQPEYPGLETDQIVKIERCDCSDIAAERDAAIVDRDQALSELQLYKLAFGDILPEPEYPVYVPEQQDETYVSYEDQYEYSHYEPESYINDDYSDIPYQHDPVTTEYYPTDEQINYFDSVEYTPEGYYSA